VRVDLVEVLDAVDRAVASAEGVVAPSSVSRAAMRARELRKRRGFQGSTLVLALAGGTGTGKSSLLNAIAGSPVASVSSLRPHTERPLAWVPRERGPGIDEMLDALGIVDRAHHDHGPELALIDLPDMDSIATSHRRVVEEVLPRVDGIIWVFDHLKYGDPLLHDEYLAPLADYGDQLVFVLNKIDLLDDDDLAVVMEGVTAHLRADGYDTPTIFAVAASPRSGGARGVAELVAHISTRLDAKRVAAGKWLIDIERELRRLGEEAGVWSGATVHLRERWSKDRDAAAAAVMPGRGPGARSDAVCRLEDLAAMVAVEVGERVGVEVRRRLPEGVVEEALEDAASAAAAAAERRRRRPRRESEAMRAAIAVLDERIGRPLREALEARARFAGALVEAAVAAASAASDADV
jgi:predicted GTPase